MLLPNASFKDQRGCTCWWLKETPSPHPHVPLHSCRLLTTLSRSTLGPFLCMHRVVYYSSPQTEGIVKQRGLSLTWSDLISTFGINLNIYPEKIIFIDHFLKKKLNIYPEKIGFYMIYRTLDGLLAPETFMPIDVMLTL